MQWPPQRSANGAQSGSKVFFLLSPQRKEMRNSKYVQTYCLCFKKDCLGRLFGPHLKIVLHSHLVPRNLAPVLEGSLRKDKTHHISLQILAIVPFFKPAPCAFLFFSRMCSLFFQKLDQLTKFGLCIFPHKEKHIKNSLKNILKI